MPLAPYDQTLKLDLLVIMPVPKSWTKTKRAEALAVHIRPAVTHNIAKLYCDAMNNVYG